MEIIPSARSEGEQIIINYTMWDTPPHGGVRVIFEIVNKLIERGHEVSVTSLAGRNDYRWFPLKTKVDYVRNSLPLKAIDYMLRMRVRLGFHLDLAELLAKNTPDCDVNVATFSFTAFAVHRSGKGIPFYHIQHYEPMLFSDPYFGKMVGETYYLPLNKIANSIWLKNQLEERHGFCVPVINPGVNLDTFHPRQVQKDSEKKRVLCYGKEAEWKGFRDALDAMKIVMNKEFNVEFIVYGSTPISYWNPEVPYNFVQFPSDEELAELYSSADCVVCPSWYESFPLPPLEAMACGAPVVTTRIGTEDYAFHEENALVVPPRKPQMMADAILRILSDGELAERLKKRGIETAKRFTWDNTADKVEKLFEDALSGRKSFSM